jgi:hypothetical protein
LSEQTRTPPDESECAINVPWREVTVTVPPDVVGALENVAGAFGISLEALFFRLLR